jgi:predicted permease
MDALKMEIRHTFRMFRQNVFYSTMVVLILALGLGATNIIFSAVNAILLRPLPFANADRVLYVWLTEPSKDISKSPLSTPELRDYREQSRGFDQLATYFDNVNFNVMVGSRPEQYTGARISSNLLDVLGVKPFVGRSFLPEEEQVGHHRSVLLSYGLWRRAFGSDRGIVGQSVMVNGNPHLVVGVMPPDFSFPTRETELWAPLPLNANPSEPERRDNRWVTTVGLLKNGWTTEQAQQELLGVARRLADEYPEDRGVSVNLVPLQAEILGNVRLPLTILLAAVGLIMLIVCADVASMLLARGAARGKELAIRVALGASRRHIVRQLLVESLILTLLGGGIGSLLSLWGIDLLKTSGPSDIPRLQEVSFDGRVLLFALTAAVLTGVVSGLMPALQVSRPDIHGALKEGGRDSSLGGKARRTFNLLVIGEVVLALVLLVSAGLLGKSFVRLLNVDPGFRPENVLTMQISLPTAKYSEGRQVSNFFQQVITRVKTLPGVQSVGAVQSIPLGSGLRYYMSVDVPGQGAQEGQGIGRTAAFFQVTPDYFRTMGAPILMGRAFNDQDEEHTQPAAIISRSAVRTYFPNTNPIGQTIRLGSPAKWGPWLNIVGVVPDMQFEDLNNAPAMQVYTPHAQGMQVGGSFSSMVLAVRSASNPEALAGSVREQVWAVDKDQPVAKVETMEQIMSAALSQRRFIMTLLAGFALVALMLTAMGIYGTISYSVARRRQEIGVRMALGAQRLDVFKMVVWQGLTLALIGTVIGLLCALALTRYLSSLLFGVTANDPLTYLLTSLVILGVTVVACYAPAHRAMRVDPLVALRGK